MIVRDVRRLVDSYTLEDLGLPMRDRDGGVDPRQAVESVESASRFMRDHGIKTATGASR